MSSIYSGKNQISGGGSSGGDATTVNGHTVESDVPSDAVFTDTIYDDSELSNRVNSLNYAQKTINTELGHCFNRLKSSYVPVANEYLPFVNADHGSNISSETTGLFQLKANHTYELISVISYTGSSSAANILYAFYDKTRDAYIMSFRPSRVSSYECSNINVCHYTPSSDCEVGIKVISISTSDTLDVNTSLSINEIGRDITIDPVDYVNEDNGIEDTPVGHIISFMGNNAPKHYLICDGTEYNISDYPYLSEHIKTEFGSYDYFGGDGTSTFAVPDLRGEFLRGTGVASRNTGSGTDVGVHQDGTVFPNIFVYNSHLEYATKGDGTNNIPDNKDTKTGLRTITHYSKFTSTDTETYENDLTYTSRPTNTSVLYCIKYEPTYFMNYTHSGSTRTTLFDGSYIIQGDITKKDKEQSDIDISLTVSDDIDNYDEIEIEYSLYNPTTKFESYFCDICKLTVDRSISKGGSLVMMVHDLLPTCSMRALIGFKTSTQLYVNDFIYRWSTSATSFPYVCNAFNIYKITGIKY